MERATAVAVVLDEATRRQLERTAASASGQVRQVLRARIVLGAADEMTNGQIAVACATSVNTVRKWRGRFVLHGLPGLDDAHRPGRPTLYGPQARVQIVATATSTPPYPESTWSHRRIAERLANLGISSSQVGRILNDLDIRPHRVRGWLTRRDDPAFWERTIDVCGLYLAPPPGTVRVSIDEKTSVQAKSRKYASQSAAVGRLARQELEYIRHGTVSIIAAMDIDTGQVITEPISRNNAMTFVEFLGRLDAAIDPANEIHLVLDNGSSHTAKRTKAWFQAHPRWHLHRTPPHASWLNVIEIWFSTLTKRVLRYGDFPSRSDLIDKIEAFTILHNETARPYRWTYDGTPLKAPCPSTN
ncbi:IS630 family transposase [Streptomyces pseudovenezuelae]|uniref:Transposase n=1 Tax=Streptomyces pseudovenezuelae TaxID=67350 RepID=A0ABT6M028_9ACTN|nr:IS630 family transposase [Streptomyces pseudovenezuelae]MDH6221440.1 transposase [Streptomyces pseudovenezuelae]